MGSASDGAVGSGRLTRHYLLERLDTTTLLEDVVQSRNLNQPSHIVREQFVLDDPLRELVPLRLAATVDTDSILLTGRQSI